LFSEDQTRQCGAGAGGEHVFSGNIFVLNFHNSPQSNGAVGVNTGEVKNQNEQLLQQLSSSPLKISR
jgi:hypothetical protein